MAKREMVDAHVDALLRRITGAEKVGRDQDGDWPFELEHSVMYVRVVGDTDSTVRVWATAATGLPETEQLYRKVNTLNQRVEFSRVLASGGDVVVVADLLGETLDREELETALRRVAAGASAFGTELVEELGGSLVRPPQKQAQGDGSTGMYL